MLPSEIVVWQVDLNTVLTPLARLASLLSPPEQERASRFYFEADRRRFIVAHSALRLILGDYTGLDPARLSFVENEYGKPSLRQAAPAFNLSHARDKIVVAVAGGPAVGVDVEYIRPLADYAAIARQQFAPAEGAALQRLPEAHRLPAFYTIWTRKEAYIKGVGRGLSLPLDSFAVTPGEPPQLEGAPGWSLYTLQPGPGYVGAVAAPGGGHRVSLRPYQISV